MGLLTPLGGNVQENWLNLRGKKSGIGCYPQENYPVPFHYLGKVNHVRILEDVDHTLSSQMRFLNRGSILGFAAAQEAIAHSARGIESYLPERRALYIGAGDFTNVGYEFLSPAIRQATSGKHQELDHRKLNLASLSEVHPFFLLESIHNNLFSLLSAFFDLKGANTTLAGASPCGAQALELACRCLQQDSADVALVVGCGNWITAIPRYEMMDLGMLSRCKDGIHSLKPFDRRRDGFITGEGGAALLLEAEEHAKRRGANILGSVGGTGNCMDFSADRKWGVPATVSLKSMQGALEEAACDVGDLAFICPHGSATTKGDRSELRSIMSLLDVRRPVVPICGMKGYTAHLGAASDIAEIILGIETIENRMVPATLNFSKSEQEFSELKISNIHQPLDKLHFLSVSYGLGGQSSSVLIKGRKRIR
jgi:3-oxoacyl-[acyl-carrier-protein] synthase II